MTFFDMSYLGVILQVMGRDSMFTLQMMRLHTQSLTYHVLATVVSCCLLCGFHLPECPSLVVGPL